MASLPLTGIVLAITVLGLGTSLLGMWPGGLSHAIVVLCLFAVCSSRSLARRSFASKPEVPSSGPQKAGWPSAMFVNRHVCHVADTLLEWWQEVVGRIYQVDFEPGVPGSVPRPPLTELGSLLRSIRANTPNAAAAVGQSEMDATNAGSAGFCEPVDDIWASRALIATDFDVAKASHIVRSYVDWRRRNPGLTIPMQAWIDYAIVIVPFVDKWDRPVAISRLRSYHKGLPLSVMTNGYRATADGVIAHLVLKRGSAPSQSNPLEQWILCIDCEGIGWGNFSMEYIQMFVRESNARYMERIAAIYLLTPPSYWQLMWNMMRPFLHPRTLRKIQLVPASKVPTVMRDLLGTRADTLLPPNYGGSAPAFPRPGQGWTLEEKVGALLAETWRHLGAVKSEDASGASAEKMPAAAGLRESRLCGSVPARIAPAFAFACCGSMCEGRREAR